MSHPKGKDKDKIPPHKVKYWKLQADLDKNLGPSSLRSKLSQRDMREAEQAFKVGERLYMTYPRLSPEELAVLVSQAVKVALSQATLSLQQRVISFLTGAILGA